ncbi:MAG: hypothetical protein AAGA15_00075 [Pseudomonadota bacterium]
MTRAGIALGGIALALAALIGLTQAASYSQEVINWDESTFMVMAQDLLDGNLPYLGLYDNKPPGIFLWLAGIMAIFGETLFAVRLFGDACLLGSALIVVWLVGRGGDAGLAARFAPGFIAGAMLVAMHSFRYGLYTSSELPAALLLMAALAVIIRAPHAARTPALAGLLISLAVLTRSNLGPVAVGFGLYFAVESLRQGGTRGALAGYVLAGLAPVAGLVAVYSAMGGLEMLRIATIEVPLAYAGAQASPGEALARHGALWAERTLARPWQFGLFSLWAGIGMAATLLKPGAVGWSPAGIAALWLMTLAIAASIALTGSIYLSYWLQILPVFAVFAGIGLRACLTLLLGPTPTRALIAVGLAVLLAALPFRATGPAPDRLATLLSDPGAVTAGHPLRAAARAIEDVRAPGDAVWALEQHLVLFYLELDPPVPVLAHPQNIVRAEIAGPLEAAGFLEPDALATLYASRPAFVVTDGDGVPDYLPDPVRFDAFLDGYSLLHTGPGIAVWRRDEPDT